ncbi:hypothetical protein MHM84_08315 [Halomonas sp. McH1-25]|uniref:hypothetical protein n=1 Tax=unclassified Halomonas TaxID=2609666 RepID=UPI001EF42251|nr:MULTISPECIES: hypothetical protein [unclassified Halomonas]MCG7599788.1 hypothetical protein [Halomonas sp. McH1-25]MCP1341683.1 hypothetical protein [Halomonas sp. FL8]MCP1359841.1 hypothetical protein [Halomonas sp. BBD45]MCP1367002.1 hypothetical protein [Halomonas sp. BBD48]
MFEAFEFSATSQRGEPVTLVAFLQFTEDAQADGETAYRLGPIQLSTADGRAVDYVSGQFPFVCQDGCDAFMTDNEDVLNLLMMSPPASQVRLGPWTRGQSGYR